MGVTFFDSKFIPPNGALSILYQLKAIIIIENLAKYFATVLGLDLNLTYFSCATKT